MLGQIFHTLISLSMSSSIGLYLPSWNIREGRIYHLPMLTAVCPHAAVACARELWGDLLSAGIYFLIYPMQLV